PRSAEVEGEEVVDRLASHDLAGLAVADGDDARAGQLVVAAREAAPVRAGDGYREQVAGADVAGQHDVADDDVAALAVLADHAREPRRCVGGARGDRGGVDGVVEDRADVVAHAAVDRDVDALAAVVEPDGLDGPDPVQGGDGGSDERTAGLERQRGDGG